MIESYPRVRSSMRKLIACAGLCFVAFARAATPTPASVSVDPCSNPYQLLVRVSDPEGIAVGRYDIGNCLAEAEDSYGLGGNADTVVTRKNGKVDLTVKLRLDKKVLSYAIDGLEPGAAERPLQRVGHDDGPAMAASLAVDHRKDYVSVYATNAPALQVATAIAQAKNIEIEHIERVGNSRITFKFQQMPLHTALLLLADFGDVLLVRRDDLHYAFVPLHHPAEYRRLTKNIENATPAERERTDEKLLALAGAEPKSAEEVEPFTYDVLERLAKSASERKDFARAAALSRRALGLCRLVNGNSEPLCLNPTIDVAIADLDAGNSDQALAALAHAETVASAEPADADGLRRIAEAQIKAGNGEKADRILETALASATEKARASIEILAARRDVAAERFDSAAKRQKEAFLFLDFRSMETDGETEQFVRTDEALISHYEHAKHYDLAEPIHRRCIELASRRWGADHSLTADQVYFLAMNLLHQDRFDAAQAQFERYLDMDAKQPEPGLFRSDSIETLMGIRLYARDYEGALIRWRELVDLRLRALGSKDPNVILALREAAILAAIAGDEKQRVAVDSEATRFEQATHGQPPDPKFPSKSEYDARFDRRSMLEMFASIGASAASKMPAAQLDRLAAMFEAYAESAARPPAIAEADKKIASAYQTALALRERCCGRDNDAARRTARRLAEWYDGHGRTDDAKKLRTNYALE